MIIQADILAWADEYTGPKFHAAFGDPPYGLNENEVNIHDALQDWLNGKEHRPKGSGFMARDWDSFLPGPAIWAAIRRHCHPGAILFAFGGTRTADLLGIAIRLGGWEKVDEIDYVYAVGFPKNHNLGKAQDNRAFRAWLKEHPQEQELLRVMKRAGKHDLINKKAAQGYERELRDRAGLAPAIITQRRHQPKFDAAGFAYRQKDNGYNSKDREIFDVTIPASEQGQIWDGYGTALKPAHEPILVFRNPFRGTYAENCERTGAGALNIAGGRIGTAKEKGWPVSRSYAPGQMQPGSNGDTQVISATTEGRWPANLILAHSFDCADTCAPDCPVLRLGQQSGESESKAGQRRQINTGQFGGVAGDAANKDGISTERGHTDTGTAARFFFQADWFLDRLEAADPIAYYSKASKSEREAGLDPMQIRLLREVFGDEEFGELEEQELSRPVPEDQRCASCGKWYPKAGRLQSRPTSTCTCDTFSISTIDDGRQTPIDNPYQRGETKRRNIHPCIKPLSLTRYLAQLLLPPHAYTPRRILIPFSGSGSEYLGALLAGWEEIIGVEMNEVYAKIAEARIAYWQQMRHRLMNPDAPVRVRVREKAPEGQLELF